MSVVFAHLTLIRLLQYLVKSRSHSLAVYNNEFILGSACVGSENHCESTKSLKIFTCLTLIVSTLRSCCQTYIQCAVAHCLELFPQSHIHQCLKSSSQGLCTSNFSAWTYCCKRPNYVFCISRCSVATVLKWGGQNHSHLRQVSSWCSMPKTI